MAEPIDSTTITFLSEVNFKFTITRLPYFTYYVQDLNLPGFSIGFASMPSTTAPIPLIGDQINWDTIVINFKVDGQLKNYLEVFNWMKNIGHPENVSQGAKIGSIYKNKQQLLEIQNKGRYSDGSLIVLDGNKVALAEFQVRDMFPISLSPLKFVEVTNDINYITAAATFKFQNFELKQYPALD